MLDRSLALRFKNRTGAASGEDQFIEDCFHKREGERRRITLALFFLSNTAAQDRARIVSECGMACTPLRDSATQRGVDAAC
jgi:hypothetical protein